MEANLPGYFTARFRAVSGFVLAGGESSRMGRNKAMLPWKAPAAGSGTLLGHAVDRLRPVCTSVKICSSQEHAADALVNAHSQPYSAPQNIARIPDALLGAGPLGGIVAALEQSVTDWNLFLAVDLPLVPVRFLQSLLGRIPDGPAAPLCVLPMLANRPQPLCSLLHRSLAPELRLSLEAGRYKVLLALQAAAVRIAAASIPLDLWEIQDLHAETGLRPAEWFLNVNTPADWKRAQKLASGEPDNHL